MKTRARVAVASLLLAGVVGFNVSAVNAQEFVAYEGKSALREGEGGTKKSVDGIDFWSDGAPPRKFLLLGFINDRRHKTGLFGMISMSNLESSVAEVAKKNGGNAVILVSSEAETVGMVGNSFGGAQGSATTVGNTTTGNAVGWQTGAASAVKKQNSKFAVVKYVDEAAVNSDSGTKAQAEQPVAGQQPAAGGPRAD